MSCQIRCDDVRSDRYHADAADLGYERDCAGCARVGFENEDLAHLDGILHVHQTDNMHLFGYLSRIFLDGLKVLLRNVPGGDDAG